ncbi:MAG: hypothetical protein LBS93_05555 [Synergistaceae bacterium]|jgi:hypothetical protein|nr:hypothetical protein [Synergistaceae bacterium]
MSTGQYDLLNCGLCGKAFVKQTGGRPTCPECQAEEDILYRKIRTVLSDYPDRRLGIADVARLVGAEERKINYLVDSGMFKLVNSVGALKWNEDDSKNRL